MLLFTISTVAQIEGEVVNEQNKPVPNVIITATDTTGKVVVSVKSDKRGFYAIDSLLPGKYKVEARASGFITAVFKNIEVTTPPKGTNKSDDTYYAISLDITLTRLKNPK